MGCVLLCTINTVQIYASILLCVCVDTCQWLWEHYIYMCAHIYIGYPVVHVYIYAPWLWSQSVHIYLCTWTASVCYSISRNTWNWTVFVNTAQMYETWTLFFPSPLQKFPHESSWSSLNQQKCIWCEIYRNRHSPARATSLTNTPLTKFFMWNFYNHRETNLLWRDDCLWGYSFLVGTQDLPSS